MKKALIIFILAYISSFSFASAYSDTTHPKYCNKSANAKLMAKELTKRTSSISQNNMIACYSQMEFYEGVTELNVSLLWFVLNENRENMFKYIKTTNNSKTFEGGLNSKLVVFNSKNKKAIENALSKKTTGYLFSYDTSNENWIWYIKMPFNFCKNYTKQEQSNLLKSLANSEFLELSFNSFVTKYGTCWLKTNNVDTSHTMWQP